jgi:hypothetical protein
MTKTKLKSIEENAVILINCTRSFDYLQGKKKILATELHTKINNRQIANISIKGKTETF